MTAQPGKDEESLDAGRSRLTQYGGNPLPKPVRRPPRWLRIVAAVVAVVYCALLIPDHELQDVLETAVLAPFFLLFAISPQGLFDGRSAAWIARHPILFGGVMFVFLGTMCLSGLAEIFDWGPAVAIMLPVTAVAVAVATFFDRTARRTMPSAEDS
ncbi:hypothetical protein [Kribbella sp. NPDC006257]|uniref:hypothetical protein n=1 Tax=Kribbella sp. NPDC006257 TaxID=3156738 RepID=UPI0033BD576F